MQDESREVNIARIAEDVFQTMLGIGVERLEGSMARAHNSLTASVHFAGEWKGALLIECGVPQALAFTSMLMPGLSPTSIDGDVRDAMGEIANMIGGNLKPLLPPGVALSMPSVVEGSDYAVHLCRGKQVEAVHFASPPGGFCVTFAHMPLDSTCSNVRNASL